MFRALSVEKWLLVLGLLLVAATLAVSEGCVKHPEVVKHVLSLLRAGVQEWYGWGKKAAASMVLALQPQLKIWDQSPEARWNTSITGLLSTLSKFSAIETNITFLRVMVANPCVSSIFTLLVIRVLFYGILIYLQNKVQGSKLRSKCKPRYLSARKASMVWF